jgi:hypothetical protein
MHQETPSPSLSSRKIFHVLKSFHRAAGMHSCCQKFRKIQSSVSFSSVLVVNLASSRLGSMLPVPPSYPSCRTVVWTVASIGGELAGVHRPRERRQQWPLRAPESSARKRRRPAPPKPPEATAWPSSSLSAPQNRRRGLGCTEHALCRRRARELRSIEPWSIAQV